MSVGCTARHLPGTLYALLIAALAVTSCAPDVVIGYASLRADGGVDGDMSSDAEADAELPLADVTWMSGGHPGNDLPLYIEFGEWRGRPLALATLFPDRASWDGITRPAWPVDMFAPFDGLLVLSLPPYPEGLGTNVDCAMGAYNDEWARLGTFLSDRGRPDTILRLGWGPNDVEHEWYVSSNADGTPNQVELQNWLDCFRNLVTAVRSTAPQIRIDWTFNSVGPSRFETYDPYATYPGDEYVDYVGIELFDMYPPARTDADWDAVCNAPTGLCPLFDFARAHGKQVGIAEWGVAGCDFGGVPNDNVGGDNPFFIEKVFETFAANADVLAYEAYFEDGGGDICSRIDTHPLSKAKYRELFGGR